MTDVFCLTSRDDVLAFRTRRRRRRKHQINTQVTTGQRLGREKPVDRGRYRFHCRAWKVGHPSGQNSIGDNQQLSSLTFSDTADPPCLPRLLRTLEASVPLTVSRASSQATWMWRRATDGIGCSLVFSNNKGVDRPIKIRRRGSQRPLNQNQLVFIDGLRGCQQVNRDIFLKALIPGGIIVTHDCNLQREVHATHPIHPQCSGLWNGDCYKSMVLWRTYSHVDACVEEFDWGCDIVVQRPNT
jgi:hypothetical protein